MIYDYLFYKSYKIAKKSNNWEDTPILFSTMITGWCIILNFGTVLFLLEGLVKQYSEAEILIISKITDYKHLVGGVGMFLTWWFYKKRSNNIIAKYEAIEKKRGKSIHPAIVLIIANVVSFVLGMLAAMYRNGDLF